MFATALYLASLAPIAEPVGPRLEASQESRITAEMVIAALQNDPLMKKRGLAPHHVVNQFRSAKQARLVTLQRRSSAIVSEISKAKVDSQKARRETDQKLKQIDQETKKVKDAMNREKKLPGITSTERDSRLARLQEYLDKYEEYRTIENDNIQLIEKQYGDRVVELTAEKETAKLDQSEIAKQSLFIPEINRPIKGQLGFYTAELRMVAETPSGALVYEPLRKAYYLLREWPTQSLRPTIEIRLLAPIYVGDFVSLKAPSYHDDPERMERTPVTPKRAQAIEPLLSEFRQIRVGTPPNTMTLGDNSSGPTVAPPQDSQESEVGSPDVEPGDEP